MKRKPIEQVHSHLSKAEKARRTAQESAAVGLPARPQGLNRNLRNWWEKAIDEFGPVLTPDDSEALLSFCQAKAAKDAATAEMIAARFRGRPGYRRPEAPKPAPDSPQTASVPELPTPALPLAADCGEAAYQYARDVLDGRIVAGKLVKLACQRFCNDLWRDDIQFDPAAAQHVADYLARLGLTLMGWQQFLIANLFGFKRGSGLRRFRSGYVQVAKKAGKSTLLAGLALYMADPEGDGEPNSQTYVAATTKFQSQSICYQNACQLRESSPDVAGRSEGFKDEIQFSGGSVFAPLAANSDKLNGLNIHFGILDELSDHPNEGLYNVFRTSTVGRKQPLVLSITTAGHTRQSIAWEVRAHAEQVLEGVIPDDGVFAFIAELDREDDEYNESVWIKANVSLGVTQHIENLQQLASDSKLIKRTYAAFRRFHLNKWPDREVQEAFFKLSVLEKEGNAYLPGQKELSPDKRIEAARARLKGRPCHGGLDLAITEDLTCFCMLFPPKEEDGIFEVIYEFFCPEESVERRSREQRVPYDIWAREKFITQTSGSVTDFRKVRSVILEHAERYHIIETGFDIAMAQDFSLELRDAGMQMTQVKQGSWMDAAIQRLERLFICGRLCFHGHPIALWNLSNVVIGRNSQNRYRFEKDKAREKIDGAVALACAMDRFLSMDRTPTSPYVERGIIFLDDWDEFNRKEQAKKAGQTNA